LVVEHQLETKPSKLLKLRRWLLNNDSSILMYKLTSILAFFSLISLIDIALSPF
jgi:hypothetical protein